MDKIFNNVCSLDCRGSCRIKTKVEKGRIISVDGDPLDQYTLGSLCAKGYAHPQRIYSPERITHPMKQGRKGRGNWQRISWEQALTEIGERLIAVKDRHQSLLPVCLNRYLGNMGILAKAVEGFFNSIGYITYMKDSPCVATGIDALQYSFGTSKKPIPEDMLNSQLILIWGGNPAWTTPHQMRIIFEARERGALLVVIDPVLTATAARSDLYIQIKPGTDLALALGLAKILVEQNLIDQSFLEQRVQGWEGHRDFLVSLDLNSIAEITGIPVVEMKKLAHLIGTTKPMTIWLGAGVQHTSLGGSGFRSIFDLAAMTGNIGVSGGNIHYATFDAWDFAEEFASINPPPNTAGNMNGEGERGHRYVGTGRFSELASLTPPIEFLWVAGHNPVSQAPDTNEVKKALEAIETVVVADLFLTATAQYADYFLPVASQFEYEDIVVSYWHYGAAVNEQAIEPLGESKSDFQIMRELAQELNRQSPGFSTFPTERRGEEWLDLEMKPLYPQLGIEHYGELADYYHRVALPDVPWTDGKFFTSSGRYEILGPPEEGDWQDLQAMAGNRQGREYPFRLLRIRSYAILNSQYRGLKEMREPAGRSKIIINPLTAREKAIEEGGRIKVYNQLGQIILPASISPSVPLDIVALYIGSDVGDEIEFNSLIALKETDLGELCSDGKGLAFNSSYVNLVRV